MSSITELKSSLISLLSENFTDISVGEKYPVTDSPVPQGKPFIAVDIKQFQQSDRLNEQQINITAYVPFSFGSKGCAGYIEQITDLVEQSGLDGYQSIKSGEVKYDSKYKCFSMTVSAEFSLKVQSITFGNTQISCPAEKVKIVCSRQLAKKFSPFVGEIVQDLGIKARTITCTCEMNADKYLSLYSLFSEGSKNTLSLPQDIELEAILSTISISCITKDMVCCQLIFTEVPV